MNPESMIGIRANWTCAACPSVATTHQIATLDSIKGIDGAVVVLQPPQGWTPAGREIYCPLHVPPPQTFDDWKTWNRRGRG